MCFACSPSIPLLSARVLASAVTALYRLTLTSQASLASLCRQCLYSHRSVFLTGVLLFLLQPTACTTPPLSPPAHLLCTSPPPSATVTERVPSHSGAPCPVALPICTNVSFSSFYCSPRFLFSSGGSYVNESARALHRPRPTHTHFEKSCFYRSVAPTANTFCTEEGAQRGFNRGVGGKGALGLRCYQRLRNERGEKRA